MLGVENTVARESPPSVITMEASTIHVNVPTAPMLKPGFINEESQIDATIGKRNQYLESTDDGVAESRSAQSGRV